MEKKKLIRVDIIALIEDELSSNPIVILHDRFSNRLLPIWVGDAEARAIAIGLNKMKVQRPLTHTLLLNVVATMGGKLARVVIDGLKNHTYYATVCVKTEQKEIEIDSRPSDAIAIALEADIPIFVDGEIMRDAGQINPFPEAAMRQEMRKEDLSGDNLKKLKDLLLKAREREKKFSEQ